MNNNSLKQYFDKENQRRWNSIKARIVREFRVRPNQHSRELAIRLKLSNEAIKKRLTDLINEDVIEVVFDTMFMNRTVSVYQIKEQLSIFKPNKKETIRQWLTRKHPQIMHEFDSVKNHKNN